MVNTKSIVVAFQEAGWLMIVLLICATTIAASSILVPPRLRFLSPLVSRYLGWKNAGNH